MMFIPVIVNVYIICIVTVVIMWGVSIYKSARAREFALERLKNKIPALVSVSGDLLNKAEVSRLVFGGFKKLRELVRTSKLDEVRKVEADLVSLYMIRSRLGIRTELFVKELAKLSSQVINFHLSMREQVTLQIRIESVELNRIDRKFVIERFSSNAKEMTDLADEERSLVDESAVSRVGK